jgi:hypothetical protein
MRLRYRYPNPKLQPDESLIFMPPEQFNQLAVAPMKLKNIGKPEVFTEGSQRKKAYVDKETGRIYYKFKLGKVYARIKQGKEMDAPYLTIRNDDCKVINHEGRHRAKASQMLGIKEIPVILRCRTRGWGDLKFRECSHCVDELKPQFGNTPEMIFKEGFRLR